MTGKRKMQEFNDLLDAVTRPPLHQLSSMDCMDCVGDDVTKTICVEISSTSERVIQAKRHRVDFGSDDSTNESFVTEKLFISSSEDESQSEVRFRSAKNLHFDARKEDPSPSTITPVSSVLTINVLEDALESPTDERSGPAVNAIVGGDSTSSTSVSVKSSPAAFSTSDRESSIPLADGSDQPFSQDEQAVGSGLHSLDPNAVSRSSSHPLTETRISCPTTTIPVHGFRSREASDATDRSIKGLYEKMMTIFHDIALLGGIALLVGVAIQGKGMYGQWETRISVPDNDCIYVTGGGFSGFWFSLGRLHSLGPDELAQQRLACYSAGCLGLVAVYANHSMPDLYEMASSLQRQWKEGSLNRYHVVEAFVENLLDGQLFAPNILQSLHILTSVPESLGFRPVIQQPTDMNHLSLLLRQSAWIPLVTGSSYTLDGHIDGGFSALQHPTCRLRVGLANDWNLLSNTLNINLGKTDVQNFWNMGLDYGI